MRPTHARRLAEAWQSVGCRASALWWPVRIAVAVGGRCMGVARLRRGCRPGGAWGTQAGGQRASPA